MSDHGLAMLIGGLGLGFLLGFAVGLVSFRFPDRNTVEYVTTDERPDR